MKTLALGMPPIGTVAHISESRSPIPEPFRTNVFTELASQYPGAYILAAFSESSQLFAMVTRSREVWLSRERVSAVVVAPTLPAKGDGHIEVAFEIDSCPPRGMLWTPGYSETAHRWMKEKAVELAALLNCSVREHAAVYDV